MPLVSMLSTGCLISCGFFANGDGLLGIRTANNKFCTQRLLYTDSGHYLLPIHHFNTAADEKLNKLITEDFKKLKKDHDKSTHKHHKPKGHLTFPVALHTDNDDDEIAPPPGLSQSPLFHRVQNTTVNCSLSPTYTATTRPRTSFTRDGNSYLTYQKHDTGLHTHFYHTT